MGICINFWIMRGILIWFTQSELLNKISNISHEFEKIVLNFCFMM